jgi:multidrug efflux system membrane fusion protein
MKERRNRALAVLNHQYAIDGIVVFLFCAYLHLFLGCKSDEHNNLDIKSIPVELAAVAYKDISLAVHSAGILSSRKEMRLSFKTGGIVDQIYVKEGQRVKKGELLAKLKLEEIRAAFIQAQNTMAKAERDMERVNNLYADSVATLEQKQDAETALNIAMSNFKVAEFNLVHSQITAPENGKVLKQFIEENELIAPGVPVFYFGSGGEKWIVKAGITDRAIIKIHLGDSADVYLDPYPKAIFPAYVTEITEAVDPMTGTYEVELQIDQKDFRLMSGFVAKVSIYPAEKQKYYLIPIEALVEADEESGYIFTMINSKENKAAKKIAVKIGPVINDKVVITEGLENIENVITTGSAYLEDGMKVNIKN